MNARTETTGSVALDLIKSVLAAALIVAGIGAYYYYPDTSVLVRAVGVVASLAIAIAVFLTTTRGRELWRFIQTSRIELRKVVWPTRQETLQTSVAVIVFALIMGVFFWLLDMLLLWVTRFLTGQGG
jgi:preprotein translocase subunit SecE